MVLGHIVFMVVVWFYGGSIFMVVLGWFHGDSRV